MSIAATAPARPDGPSAADADTVAPPPLFLVQLRYDVAVAGAGPDGWLTVAGEPDFALAVHAAAVAYAARRDPSAGAPMGVRVRSEEQLRRLGGDEAVLTARLPLRA